MKQQIFEQQNTELWDDIESLIEATKTLSIKSWFKSFKSKNRAVDKDLETRIAALNAEFPSHYRSLCQHLATAKSRGYTSALVDRLNDLVLSSHHLLYQERVYSQHQWLNFLAHSFPSAIRNNSRYVLIATLFFIVPLFLFGVGCYLNEELIYSIMDPFDVRNFESMYDPSNDVLGRERNASDDITMFGHYIYNNISIGFRSFALGLLAGVGTIFILIFNGIHIGGTAGHLTLVGYSETFYSFVVGHGPFELTAIVFCGAAGLKVGMSLISPGPFTRLEAIRIASKEAGTIVFGSAIMLLIAAFIEAFWSSSSALPLIVKYGFGAAGTIILILYFCFSGRRYATR